MKNSAKWIFVFAAGMLAYHLMLSRKPKPESSPIHEVRGETSTSESRKPTAVPPIPKIVAKIAEPVKTEKLNIGPQKPKEVINLSLSESIVGQMEYDWNDLPVQAEARRESRGWRFTRIKGDSSFYRAGLREGDLVTTEFLDNLSNSDGQLVRRMEQILNRITR